MHHIRNFVLASASVLALAAPAMAQTEASGDGAAKADDIVVTGTLIRGVAPAGSQTIAVDATTIEQKAASSTNELLGAIPQITNAFNDRFTNDARGAGGTTINRPNLRSLPGYNTASGSVTLLLVDGHRITPVGIKESAIDPDIIPPAILQNVEVITDGGSSLYGADAVAGVINFITKKRYEGVKIDLNGSLGDTISGYRAWDGAITAGKSWSTGNAYISVSHSERDGIRNNETSWARNGNWSGPLSNPVFTPTGVECRVPVNTVYRYRKVQFGQFIGWTDSSQAGGGVNRAPGATNCDQFAEQTYLPRQERTSVFASVDQDVSDKIQFHMTGYWSKLQTTFLDYPLGMTSASGPKPPAPASGFGNVGDIFDYPYGTAFSLGVNPAYVQRNLTHQIETWGITPELKIDLGGGWQLRNTLHYGRSYNKFRQPLTNRVLAQSYIDQGLLNPQHAELASAAVITDILNWEQAQDTNQQMFNFRTIADGPLFALPGGDAKLAVGLEFQDTTVKVRQNAGTRGSVNGLDFARASQNMKSAYAELNLPVFNMLDISASLRHDEYSDFGSTTNPTVGFKFRPVEWLSIFGHWGKSFNAPTALDTLAKLVSTGRVATGAIPAPTGGATIPNAPVLQDRGYWNGATSVLVLEGTDPSIKPQTAETWAIGFEAKPIDGLRFGAEYYHIAFHNVLGGLDASRPTAFQEHPEAYFAPSSAQQDWQSIYLAQLAKVANGTDLQGQFNSSSIGYILDRRIRNLDDALATGIDFHANYRFGTGLGDFDLGLAGNKRLVADSIIAGVHTTRLTYNTSDLTAQAWVGFNRGGFSSRVTVNYTSGQDYQDYTNTTANPSIQHVGPFVTTNLFLGYKFDESNGMLKGTSLRFNVDNVFGVEPPVTYANTPSLAYTYWTLGRVFKLGISKEF